MTRLLALVAAFVVALSSPAFGSADDSGSHLGAGAITVGETVTAPGSGVVGQGAGGDAATPVVRYHWTWVTVPDALDPGVMDGLCAAPGGTADAPVFGWAYRLIGTDAAGNIVDDELQCVPFVAGAPTARPPEPALPAVPTFGEVWKSAAIPAPAITLDPATRGITGLDTHISTAGPATVAIAATIRGYTVTGTANLDHYEISVDGRPAVDGGTGHYTFETKGDHLVAVSAVWHGTAVITGTSLAAGRPPIDLGTATITSTRLYAVHEIRSVLQP